MSDERDRVPDHTTDQESRAASRAAAARRIEQQHTWVDLQVRQAIARGDFDDLPGAGKPIRDLGTEHDPDWWLRKLVEREQVTGVLPPALQLRKDDAELDARLDGLASERQVREAVEEFNARVLRARYTPIDGPPLITMPRDVEQVVAGWRDRRRAGRAQAAAPSPPSPRRWWRRRERRHTPDG